MHTVFSGGSEHSPNKAITSSQDLFEPIWLEYAESFEEATIGFGTKVERVDESAEGGEYKQSSFDQSSAGTSWLSFDRLLVVAVVVTTRRLVSTAEGLDGDTRGSNEDMRGSDSVESDWGGHQTGAVYSDETETVRAKVTYPLLILLILLVLT